MKQFYLLLLTAFCTQFSFAQKKNTAFADSIKAFQKRYVVSHEVVKGKDRKFLHFYEPAPAYTALCTFEKNKDTTTVTIKTTGKKIPEKYFIRYGRLTFSIHDTIQHLTVYQSKDLMKNPLLKDYLFIPFTDVTTGYDTYGSGRYIDITIPELQSGLYFLDFNKAYNPYCAYIAGYNCPVPPKENQLTVAIKAGEKSFGKGHQ